MPERLPIWDLLRGVFLIMARFMRLTLTYTLVVTCWLGLVPLMASRTHRLVFSGLLSSFFSSRVLQLFSTENIAVDIARGSLVVTIFLCTFISLVWLREQIMIGGPAHLLHLPEEQATQEQTVESGPNQTLNQEPINTDQHTAESILEESSSDPLSANLDAPSTSSSFTDTGVSKAEVTEKSNAVDEGEQSNSDEQQPSTSSRQSRPLQHFQPVQQDLVSNNPPASYQQQQQPLNLDNQNQQQQQAQLAQNAVVDMVEQQRFVDELTWQRLLGLDGSFAFIEHVFWTISLNIVFNILFLYFPAQIGASILALCGLGPGKIQYFELPISIMVGLLVILAHGLIIHRIAKIFRLKSLYLTAGMICLMLKVFLLVITELVIFPVLCGWWLDICSLPLTGVTLEERVRNFRQYPSSSMFLHWLAGMVYVFYSASFILILRELLRPGVLWFIRNLHDPDFNPIQEMIEQPVTHHVRRLIASMTLFFSIIMLVVYVPLRLIKWLHPSTLPYVFTGSYPGQWDWVLVSHLYQVIMPTILEYSKAFSLFKKAVRLWCRIVGGWLQLDSYLLPVEKDKQDADQREQQRQRARERLLRGDQEEQIGLLEALEAIEDDTTDDEDGETDEVETASEDETPSVNASTEQANNDEDENLGTKSNNNEQRAEDEEKARENRNDVSNGAQSSTDAQQDVQEQQQQQGDEQEPPMEPEEQQQQQIQQRLQEQLEQRNLGAQHHALLRFRDSTLTEDYIRPNYFPLRIIALLFFVCLTAEAIAVVFFFVPVTIGRILLSWLALTNQPIHDLYTVAAGLYTCWLFARLAMLTQEWAQKGWSYVKKLFNSVVWLLMRVIAAAFPLLVVIPFMLGFYFQMLVISPLRVAIYQSPLFFPWKEWAMGIVHFKIICASVLMGPDWWLKTAFEQIYADGIWNFRLRDLYLNLVLPIVNALSFLIAFPYVLSKFLLLFVEANREEQVIVTRYSYPFLLCTICTVAFLTWQWQKLKMLAQKIRNDKYLIGTQLVNFYRDNTPAASKIPTSVTAKTAVESTSTGTGNADEPNTSTAIQQPPEQDFVGVQEMLRVTAATENVQE